MMCYVANNNKTFRRKRGVREGTMASSRPAAVAQDSPPATRVALRVNAVRKTFGSLEAIKNISIDIADGEFISLLGPSG
jgi:ABC-type glutathione transport system ATPase component